MERIFRVMNILLCSKTPLTIDYIASELNVSNKTIRNDLKKVDEFLSGKGLYLDKRPGVGVSIVGSEESKLNLMNKTKRNSIVEPFSPQDRMNYILKRLFMCDENITIKELSEELYVSRVTIHKDLENVEQWLKDFNLSLLKKTNYGIEIIGSEEKWRNAVASLIAQGKENEKLKELLYEDYSGRIDYRTLTKLKELINIDYKQLEKIVANMESMLKFRFSDEAFISFVIHIAISIKRLRHNKDIHLSNDIMMGLRQKDEYAAAQTLAANIEEAFKVELPESEIGYIVLHIIGAKMQQKCGLDINVDLGNIEENELPVTMSKEIIDTAEKVLGIQLSSDNQLLNGLILHLRPTINRIKYGLTLRNPILNEIKENYPEVYGVAWMTSTVFEKYIGTKINEEEIGYIALHLAAGVERQKKPLKALVVCTSGIGTSQLLAAKLERHFRQIEIKDVMSLLAIKEMPMNEIDIIISTVPVEADKPVIIISPLLNQNDLKRLDNFINEINDSKSKEKNSVKYLIREKFIELNIDYKDRNTAISSMSKKLYNDGYLKKEYIEDALNREKVIPTAVGKGVAIPHGSPEYVNQSQIAVTILNHPIKWGDEMVDIIFLICISKNDIGKSKYLFRNIYKRMDSSDFIERLKKVESKKAIIDIMEGINNADR